MEKAESAFFFAWVIETFLGFADDGFFRIGVRTGGFPRFKGFRSVDFAVGFGWGNACDFNVVSFFGDVLSGGEGHWFMCLRTMPYSFGSCGMMMSGLKISRFLSNGL